MNSKIRAIARRIKEYDDIVIARHVGPDPDAVAETCCLMLWQPSLEHKGKQKDTQQMAEEKDQLEEPKALGTTLIC